MTPMRPELRPSEDKDIQPALNKWLTVINPDCKWTHIANEIPVPKGADRKLFAKIGAWMKRKGVKKGPGDWIFLGCPLIPVWFYEVKRDDGTLSEAQKEWRAFCLGRNIPYDWAKSDNWVVHAENIKARLKEFGAL